MIRATYSVSSAEAVLEEARVAGFEPVEAIGGGNVIWLVFEPSKCPIVKTSAHRRPTEAALIEQPFPDENHQITVLASGGDGSIWAFCAVYDPRFASGTVSVVGKPGEDGE